MHSVVAICVCALFLTACRPALEKQLVGEWVSGCSIDVCTITTLNADHTFSDRFDERDFTEPVYSGTWRVEGDQLVMHATWANNSLQDITGKNFRLIVSQFERNKFVATSTDGKMKPLTWERHH